MSLDSSKPQSVRYFMYSIRDVKANVFHNPYFQQSKALAMRSFADLSRDPQSLISKHAEDFQLYEIGVFDTETASIECHDQPLYLASATEFQN